MAGNLYLVKGKCLVDMVTLVRADTEKEALLAAQGRRIDLGEGPSTLVSWVNTTTFPAAPITDLQTEKLS